MPAAGSTRHRPKCVTCAASVPDAEITSRCFAAEPRTSRAGGRPAGRRQGHAGEHPANAQPLAAVLAPQVVKLAAATAHVLGPVHDLRQGPHAPRGGPARRPQLSDVMAVEGAHAFKRPVYAGNADRDRRGRCGQASWLHRACRLLRGRAAGGSAPVEQLSVDAPSDPHALRVGGAAKSDRPDLQSAPRVVSGGRALGSAENFELIYSAGRQAQRGVGASRAAVDAGYAPNEMQVGQTGKIIAPELYVAIGISGAIQHLTGIKDARTIVAINKDAGSADLRDRGLRPRGRPVHDPARARAVTGLSGK
jgi:electron transfer flavoprotein alpha subunit